MVKRALLAATALIAIFSVASDYVDAWGPPVGTRIDPFSLSDSAGKTRSMADLMGAKGLLVFFNRSADW